jgi:hypothetical protein
MLGTRRGLLVPCHRSQQIDDAIAFDAFKRLRHGRVMNRIPVPMSIRNGIAAHVPVRDERPVRQNTGPLDGIAELAHVAFPGPPGEYPFRGGRHAEHRQLESSGAVGHERRRQIRNVFAPVPQRRHLNLHGVQPEQQVRRNLPAATSCCRSRLVAANTQVSTRSGSMDPTRCTSPASRARSNFA